MWSLVVGVAGFATVLTAAALIYRHNTKFPEGTIPFSRGDTISYCSLMYLCFYILPGALSLFGVVQDPILKQGPTAVIAGSVGLLIVAIAGSVAARSSTTSAERVLFGYRIFYFVLLLLLLFVVPGILALLGVVPNPVPGVAMAVAIAVYFFIEMWSVRQRELIRAEEKAGVGPPP